MDGVLEGARYVPPTVVLDPGKDSKLLQMELFGPVLPVVTVDSCEDAIKYINSKPKPLALYIFTPSSMAKHIIENTSSGGVVVGDCIVHKGNADLPFGGIGNSGMGRMHGLYGFRELSNERAIMKRPLFLPSPLTLPLDPRLAQAAWLYATSRPGIVLKRHLWKLIAALAAIFFVRRRMKRLH